MNEWDARLKARWAMTTAIEHILEGQTVTLRNVQNGAMDIMLADGRLVRVSADEWDLDLIEEMPT